MHYLNRIFAGTTKIYTESGNFLDRKTLKQGYTVCISPDIVAEIKARRLE
jgi:hypothetical protein